MKISLQEHNSKTLKDLRNGDIFIFSDHPDYSDPRVFMKIGILPDDKTITIVSLNDGYYRKVLPGGDMMKIEVIHYTNAELTLSR